MTTDPVSFEQTTPVEAAVATPGARDTTPATGGSDVAVGAGTSTGAELSDAHGEPASRTASDGEEPGRHHRRERLLAQMADLIRAIDDGDDKLVEDAVLQLSRRKRIFAPLTLAIGAFAMLFQGLKLLVSDWRLLLIMVLPAMWIWLAMYDLKLHVLRGREFNLWTGRLAVILVVAIALITVLSFYLNAVFGLAISRPGRPQIRPAFALARSHNRVILGVGSAVGVALGVSAILVPRWGRHWFGLSLGIVVAVMMFTYVAIPSRIIGMKALGSRRDKLTASAVGGAIGAMVCTPPYAIARGGIVLLGSRTWFALGVVLVVIGFTLQAGATGAVKAVKMSAKLVAGNPMPAQAEGEVHASGGPDFVAEEAEVETETAPPVG
jgi:hypothetical protein